MLKRYYRHQTYKFNLIILGFISIVGMSINVIVNQFSLKHQSFQEMLLEPNYLIDLLHYHQLGNFILVDSLTSMYESILLILFLLSIIVFICKKSSQLKTKVISKLTPKNMGLFLLVIFLIQMLAIGINREFISFLPREVNTLQGCYQSKLALKIGKEPVSDNRYLNRCFDTTDRIYSVYKEIEYSSHNLFDLIKDHEYTRIFVENENGAEIISIDLRQIGKEHVNIYVTTESESEQGYNNLIIVESYNEEDSIYHHYDIYDFNGTFLLHLENGIPDKVYYKNDLLDHSSMKISFINLQIIFNEVENNKVTGKYIYYLDGSKTLIEE